MRIRVIYCDDESHLFPWMKAADCSHWSMNCPRAKKAKKSRHKLVKSPVGFAVMVNGFTEDKTLYDASGREGWAYDYDPPEYALELTEKHYSGYWEHDGVDKAIGYRFPQGSRWKPTIPGLLFECSTGCGLVGAK